MANPKGNPQNLKPWKPGETPNPAGRPPNPPELKAINRLTKGELELLVNKILSSKPEDLKSFNGTVLEVWLASGAAKAIQSGDYTRLGALLDRVVGKVTDKLEMEIDVTPESEEEAAKEALDFIKQKYPKLLEE